MNTFFDTCGLMVVKLEGINGIQPFIIEHTSKTCSDNAITISHIVCVSVFLIVLLVCLTMLLWHLTSLNHKRKVAQNDRLALVLDKKFSLKQDYQSKALDYISTHMTFKLIKDAFENIYNSSGILDFDKISKFKSYIDSNSIEKKSLYYRAIKDKFDEIVNANNKCDKQKLDEFKNYLDNKSPDLIENDYLNRIDNYIKDLKLL